MKGNDSVTLQLNTVAISMFEEIITEPTNIETISIICLVLKDLTATIARRNLLQEEQNRRETLLLSILPPVIVHKLQKEDSNLTIRVPSATICFIDIIDFNSWCSSLSASTVVSSLNSLFALYDEALTKYDKITKIKCIGDCYMAAGGLFDEVNQFKVHASQIISFCLDVIQAVEIFNSQYNTTLRVRAGVNCGGPIVAGVLNRDTPFFDILDPPISVASAMEHFGVPMHVHFSEYVYSLFFDFKFDIKERGNIEIKGQKYHTYIVSGYRQ